MSDNKETSEENIEQNIEGVADEKISLTKETEVVDADNIDETDNLLDDVESSDMGSIEETKEEKDISEDEKSDDNELVSEDSAKESNEDNKADDIDKEISSETMSDDVLDNEDNDDIDHDIEFSKEINSNITNNEDAKEEKKNSTKNDDTLLRFKRILFDKQDELESPKDKMLANVLSYVKIIVVAFILAYLINTFVLSNTTIPSSSMENTIMKNDRLFGFRWAYTFSDPKRGDIIIFKYPDNEKENYIKRVIGLPGDTVEIKAGVVYVNNEKIEENYLKETPANKDFGPYKVPEESYFVLGDNRNCSKDARYWKNTYVHKDQIVAKAIFKYFPKIEFM